MILNSHKILKNYLFISAGVFLPVFRPFFIYNFSDAGDRSLIFWVMAFQAASLPVLTIALFDFSSQVFTKNLREWRRKFIIYKYLPVQVTAVLSLVASIFIWTYASVSFGQAFIASIWCFVSIVFIGKLKIIRLISVNFYYKCIFLKVSIELAGYFILTTFYTSSISFNYFVIIDCFACLAILGLISRVLYRRKFTGFSTLEERLSAISSSFKLAVGLALASICVQLDKLLLIKILPSTQYELYLVSALYRGLGMSVGAVLASFLYPQLAIHFRKSTIDSKLKIKKLLSLSYILLPLTLTAVGFTVWMSIIFFMPKYNFGFIEIISISMTIAISINIIPESYLFLEGRNKVIFINGILGILLQIIIFYFLYAIEVNNFSAYIWVIVFTLTIQSLFLSFNVYRSLAQLE